MTFGLSTQDWDVVKNLAITPLKRCGAKIYVFGSRARGDQKKFSDLDLLVEYNTPLPEFLLSQIRSQLEDSRLPIKIDVVLATELAMSFRDQVMRERIEILEK